MRRQGLALFFLASASGGCVRMAARPPAALGEDEAARREFYETWRLTPRRTWLGAIRWRRADGEYDWDQVGDLALTLPQTVPLHEQDRQATLLLAGEAAGFVVADRLLIVPPLVGIAGPEVALLAITTTGPALDAQEAFGRVYDAALRRRLELSGTEYEGDGGLAPAREPGLGQVVLAYEDGVVFTRRRDLEAYYGAALTPKTDLKTQVVTGDDTGGFTLGLPFGADWEADATWEFLVRRTRVESPGTEETDWNLGGFGALARLRWTVLRGGRQRLSILAGPGWFSLGGASITGNWFSGSYELSGSTWGGVAELVLDQWFSGHLGVSAALGYRSATIKPVTVAGTVNGAAVSPATLRNADGTEFAVDHSGVLAEGSLRFRW